MPYLTNRRPTSKQSQSKPHWHVKNVIREQDSFAKEVPSFTMDGQSKVNTTIGGLLSLAILTLTFLYATDTFIKMSEGSDPTVSQNVI